MISDRGDDFFAHFAERLEALLAEQSAGLPRVRAATSSRNLASRRVLTKAGFRRTGPAAPGDLGGQTGDWFELVLGSPPTPLE